MQLANTKQVRAIISNFVNCNAKYTDKGANNTRLVAWQLGSVDTATLKQIQDVFTLCGFSNRIKVTQSKYCSTARSGGWTYLRVNASYKETV
jgi:hypothetical protein